MQTILVQDEPRGASQLVEIPVTAGSNRIALPDVQQLRSTVNSQVIIKKIRLIPPTVLTNGITINAANATVAELQKMTLVLYSEMWQKGQYIPLLTFNDFNNSGTAPNRFASTALNNWKRVDWSQSFLQLGNGLVTVGNYVVMLDVEYIKLNAQNVEIEGPQ